MKGVAYLPLHGGKTPPKLFKHMVGLAKPLLQYIRDEFGEEELLRRLGNPFFFQSLGATLGFDWHSSGVTTVLTGVLSTVFEEVDLGLRIVGGKGARMKEVPNELRSMNDIDSERLIRISKLAAKTDTAMLQDGYDLYHHALIFIDEKRWIVIQQGMNPDIKYARRYHWSYEEDVNRFIEEPHIAVITERYEDSIINLTDRSSREAKKTMLDILRDGTLKRDVMKLAGMVDTGLNKWLGMDTRREIPRDILILPKRINWEEVRKIYMDKPDDYRELSMYTGFTKNTVRALALVANLIYGEEIHWRDTVKYTFTVGGKDGVPYPVDYKTYKTIIDFLEDAVNNSRIASKDKKRMLKRLKGKV